MDEVVLVVDGVVRSLAIGFDPYPGPAYLCNTACLLQGCSQTKWMVLCCFGSGYRSLLS